MSETGIIVLTFKRHNFFHKPLCIPSFVVLPKVLPYCAIIVNTKTGYAYTSSKYSVRSLFTKMETKVCKN